MGALRRAWSARNQKKGVCLMTYNEFLDRFCGCHEDEVGNRPCDNGCMCDKCMTPEMVELWREVHNDD